MKIAGIHGLGHSKYGRRNIGHSKRMTKDHRGGGGRGLSTNLLVLGGTIALIAMVAEVGARVLYEAPGYDQLVVHQQESEAHPYRLNQWGLRDDELSAPHESKRRVLLLGDSFTFGQGVYDDDAIFPARLENRLNEEWSVRSGFSVDLLNGGIIGSLTDHWLDLHGRTSL